MILRGRDAVLRLVTGSAGDIRVAFAYQDTNTDISAYRLQSGSKLMAVAAAGQTQLAAGDVRTERTVSQIVIANAGPDINHCTVELADADGSVPVWERDLPPGEKALFTNLSGWSVYSADGLLLGASVVSGCEIVLMDPHLSMELDTGTAGDIRASFVYADTNNYQSNFTWVTGDSLPAIAIAGKTVLVNGMVRTIRSIKKLNLANVGADINRCTVSLTNGSVRVPLWERDLIPGEKAEFTDSGGWAVYTDGLRQGGGGGSGGAAIDSTARALVKAVQNRLNAIYPPSGKEVGPGDTVSIATTDGGIVTAKNPTNNPIPVPANPTVADLQAAGLKLASASNGTVVVIETDATADGPMTLALTGCTGTPTVLVNGLEITSFTWTASQLDILTAADIRKDDHINITYPQ